MSEGNRGQWRACDKGQAAGSVEWDDLPALGQPLQVVKLIAIYWALRNGTPYPEEAGKPGRATGG